MKVKKIISIIGITNFILAIPPLVSFIVLPLFGQNGDQLDMLIPGAGMPFYISLLYWIYLVIIIFPLISIKLSNKYTENRQKLFFLLIFNIFSTIAIVSSMIILFLISTFVPLS